FSGVVVSRPYQSDNAGYVKEKIKDQVDACLDANREKAVEHIAPDVGVSTECIGAGHHEECAVKHVHDVERPRTRGSECRSGQDLVGREEGKDEHGPAESVSDLRVYPINSV